jgi:hypothetical protein
MQLNVHTQLNDTNEAASDGGYWRRIDDRYDLEVNGNGLYCAQATTLFRQVADVAIPQITVHPIGRS